MKNKLNLAKNVGKLIFWYFISFSMFIHHKKAHTWKRLEEAEWTGKDNVVFWSESVTNIGGGCSYEFAFPMINNS